MKRTWMLSALITMAVAAATLSPVGAGNGAPTWTSAPTQGPSPNTIEVEGNHCESNDVASEGIRISALVPAPSGEVIVALHDKDTDEVIHTEEYVALSGNWGGPFPIEAGLDPGVYPLRAACHAAVLQPRSGGVALGQNGVGVFRYDDRSYRVIAEAEPPGAVEAEVTVTG